MDSVIIAKNDVEASDKPAPSLDEMINDNQAQKLDSFASMPFNIGKFRPSKSPIQVHVLSPEGIQRVTSMDTPPYPSEKVQNINLKDFKVNGYHSNLPVMPLKPANINHNANTLFDRYCTRNSQNSRKK